jgi:hypothetical protein
MTGKVTLLPFQCSGTKDSSVSNPAVTKRSKQPFDVISGPTTG